MKVKFDIVRIGRIRKNYTSELVLKENLNFLKSNIRTLLSEKVIENKSNQISIVLVIPAKGFNIKIVLNDIKDNDIKKELKKHFPNSIYNGSYSVILDNINNHFF